MVQHHDVIRRRQKPRRGEKRSGQCERHDEHQKRIAEPFERTYGSEIRSGGAEDLLKSASQKFLKDPERAEDRAVKPAEKERQEKNGSQCREDPPRKRRQQTHKHWSELKLEQFRGGLPSQTCGRKADQKQEGGGKSQFFQILSFFHFGVLGDPNGGDGPDLPEKG